MKLSKNDIGKLVVYKDEFWSVDDLLDKGLDKGKVKISQPGMSPKTVSASSLSFASSSTPQTPQTAAKELDELFGVDENSIDPFQCSWLDMPDKWDFKKNPVLHGMFLKQLEVSNPKGDDFTLCYFRECVTGSVVTAGGYVINEYFQKAESGAFYRIEYRGEKILEGGKSLKKYRIDAADEKSSETLLKHLKSVMSIVGHGGDMNDVPF